MEFKPKKKHGVNKSRDTFENTSKNWLFEDEEWNELRSSVQPEPKNQSRKLIRPFVRHATAFDEPLEDEVRRKTEFNIKLTLPEISSSRFKLISKTAKKLKSLTRKQVALALACLLVVVAGVVVGNKYIFSDDYSDANVAGSTVIDDSNVPDPTNEPKFDYVEPGGRPVSKDKIAYDSVRNFAKYDDNINGTPIIVSQQPVPETFKHDPTGGIKKVAGDFGAKELLRADELELYYGQNTKGPQTLIFTKNGLFIFIITAQEVDKNSLLIYASTLN